MGSNYNLIILLFSPRIKYLGKKRPTVFQLDRPIGSLGGCSQFSFLFFFNLQPFKKQNYKIYFSFMRKTTLFLFSSQFFNIMNRKATKWQKIRINVIFLYKKRALLTPVIFDLLKEKKSYHNKISHKCSRDGKEILWFFSRSPLVDHICCWPLSFKLYNI